MVGLVTAVPVASEGEGNAVVSFAIRIMAISDVSAEQAIRYCPDERDGDFDAGITGVWPE